MSNSSTNSNKYHGGPCKHCGGTLRYKSNRGCVVCHAKQSTQWKKDNHEKILASERIRRRENRDKRNAQTRKWKRNNPDHQKIWNKKNSAKRAEYTARWSKNNRDKVNIIKQRRYARKHKAKTEPYNFNDICNHYENKCLRCGCGDVKLTIDHIKPYALGGDNIPSNIQPLCKPCNSAKKDRHIDYRPDAGPLRWVQKKLLV